MELYFCRSLFWTESEDVKNSRVFKSRTDGSDVIEILPAQRSERQKRSVGKNCQCPTDVKIDSTLGIDYTNDDIYFVDLVEKSLWRTDSDGCQCQKLFSQTSNECKNLIRFLDFIYCFFCFFFYLFLTCWTDQDQKCIFLRLLFSLGITLSDVENGKMNLIEICVGNQEDLNAGVYLVPTCLYRCWCLSR